MSRAEILSEIKQAEEEANKFILTEFSSILLYVPISGFEKLQP